MIIKYVWNSNQPIKRVFGQKEAESPQSGLTSFLSIKLLKGTIKPNPAHVLTPHPYYKKHKRIYTQRVGMNWVGLIFKFNPNETK